MTTREKVIVTVMCLTVVYGIYSVVGGRGGKVKSAPVQANTMDELRQFVGGITQQMSSAKMGSEYQYVIAQAGVDWTRDPFIQSIAGLAGQSESRGAGAKSGEGAGVATAFVYTGYLTMGDTRLAVINGMEYKLGEALDTEGHYLKSVSAERAVIGKVNSTETIQLPISEIY